MFLKSICHPELVEGSLLYVCIKESRSFDKLRMTDTIPSYLKALHYKKFAGCDTQNCRYFVECIPHIRIFALKLCQYGKLVQRFLTLLDKTEVSFLRDQHSLINWSGRMTAIVGARGVGKTTLLLQHIKLHRSTKDTVYVSADDFYFTEHKLLDFAEEFHKMGGKHLFIDEIHKYIGWSYPGNLLLQSAFYSSYGNSC